MMKHTQPDEAGVEFTRFGQRFLDAESYAAVILPKKFQGAKL